MKKIIVGLSLLFAGLGLFPSKSHAFLLTCEADISHHSIVYGYTTLDCYESKTKSWFTTEEIEIGPGIRFSIMAPDGEAVAKYVSITCPFMRAKKLLKMKEGETLFLGGVVADANMFVGARLGVEFGKPGICFVVGASAWELGGEVALNGIELTKQKY